MRRGKISAAESKRRRAIVKRLNAVQKRGEKDGRRIAKRAKIGKAVDVYKQGFNKGFKKGLGKRTKSGAYRR